MKENKKGSNQFAARICEDSRKKNKRKIKQIIT